MIRLLNLGPAKHEKVAIYVVNQRISNVCSIARAASQRSNSQTSVVVKMLCIKYKAICISFFIQKWILLLFLYPYMDIFQLTIAISDVNMDIQTTDDCSAQLKRSLVRFGPKPGKEFV